MLDHFIQYDCVETFISGSTLKFLYRVEVGPGMQGRYRLTRPKNRITVRINSDVSKTLRTKNEGSKSVAAAHVEDIASPNRVPCKGVALDVIASHVSESFDLPIEVAGDW